MNNYSVDTLLTNMNLMLNISTFEKELNIFEKKIFNLHSAIDKKRLMLKCKNIAHHLLKILEETGGIIENSLMFLEI
jgi:hypothetical protein